MLKTVVDSLDGIEEQYRGLYEEKDGKYILQIEGVDSHPSVVALKNGHMNSKRERDEAKRQLAELKKKLEAVPEDFDADEWHRLRSEEEARRSDPDNKDVRKQIEAATAAVKSQYEARLAKAKKDAEAALAEIKAEKESLEADLRGALVDDGLTKALVKVGVKPTLLRAAKRMFDADVEVVIEDGKRVARMKSDLGGDSIEDFIANWSRSDEAKDFIAPPTGADERGARGGRGMGADNPFSKSAWNKTVQGELLKTNRAKAEQLAKSAGFKTLESALAARGPVSA